MYCRLFWKALENLYLWSSEVSIAYIKFPQSCSQILNYLKVDLRHKKKKYIIIRLIVPLIIQTQE